MWLELGQGLCDRIGTWFGARKWYRKGIGIVKGLESDGIWLNKNGIGLESPHFHWYLDWLLAGISWRRLAIEFQYYPNIISLLSHYYPNVWPAMKWTNPRYQKNSICKKIIEKIYLIQLRYIFILSCPLPWNTLQFSDIKALLLLISNLFNC